RWHVRTSHQTLPVGTPPLINRPRYSGCRLHPRFFTTTRTSLRVDPNGACFSSHLRMSLSDLRSGFTAKLATIQTRPRATTATAIKTPRRIGLTRIRRTFVKGYEQLFV